MNSYLTVEPLAEKAVALIAIAFEIVSVCSLGDCMQKLPSGDAFGRANAIDRPTRAVRNARMGILG